MTPTNQDKHRTVQRKGCVEMVEVVCIDVVNTDKLVEGGDVGAKVNQFLQNRQQFAFVHYR